MSVTDLDDKYRYRYRHYIYRCRYRYGLRGQKVQFWIMDNTYRQPFVSGLVQFSYFCCTRSKRRLLKMWSTLYENRGNPLFILYRNGNSPVCILQCQHIWDIHACPLEHILAMCQIVYRHIHIHTHMSYLTNVDMDTNVHYRYEY